MRELATVGGHGVRALWDRLNTEGTGVGVVGVGECWRDGEGGESRFALAERFGSKVGQLVCLDEVQHHIAGDTTDALHELGVLIMAPAGTILQARGRRAP